MPIIDGGKRRPVVSEKCKAANGNSWKHRQYNFKVFGKTIQQIEIDMQAIRKHFGVNRQVAFRTSLHLVAEAIRKGRLSL